MTTHTTGTFRHGVIQLDQPVELPENTRVLVSFTPDKKPAIKQNAMAALKEIQRKFPPAFNGMRFTRDELHDRR